MKQQIFIFCLLIVTTYCIAQEKIEKLPDNIDINNFCGCSCEYDTLKIKSMINEKDFGREGKLPDDHSEFKFVDLNADNKCEVLHYFTSALRGWPYDFLTIYKIENGSLKKMGDFGSFFLSFGESDGEYLQINKTTFKGHKTNPIYYQELWRVKNDKYEKFYAPDLNKGEFKQEGLIAYKQKNYAKAYLCFNNVLHFPHNSNDDYLNSLNDVAITLIKLGRYNEIETLFKNRIKKAKNGKSIASAYYNIALSKEKEGMIDEALKYFKLSEKYNNTKAAQEKINKYER